MGAVSNLPKTLPYRVWRGLLSILAGGGAAAGFRGRRRVPALLLGLLLLVGGAQARTTLTVIGLPVTDPLTRVVVEEYTLARQLKPVRFISTVKATDWLMDRPILAAALARHLHPALERYHVTETGAGQYLIDDMDSLRGSVRLVARAPERRIYFVEGSFRSLAHILNLSGSMVFTLQYRERWDEGESYVEVDPQLFLRIDSPVAHSVLKVLAPLLHGTIDRRIASLTAASQAVSERLAKDPQGLYREMQTWPDVRPGDLVAYRQAFRISEEAR